jgi:hypothetical protein
VRGPERSGCGKNFLSSVQHAVGRCQVGELAHGIGDPAPGRGAVVIVACGEFVSSRGAFIERFLALALQHQGGGAPDIDLRYYAGKIALAVEKRLTPIIARFAKDIARGIRRRRRRGPHKASNVTTLSDLGSSSTVTSCNYAIGRHLQAATRNYFWERMR